MTSSATAPNSDRRFSFSTQVEDDASPVSAGRLPVPKRVRDLLYAAYERFTSLDEGENADVYPALLTVSGHWP